MARIHLQFPKKILFSTQLTVRIGDLNYGNHLSNDAFLSYAHEARVQFLKHLGYANELSVEEVGLIMGDAAIVFKQQAFLGDLIGIELGVSDLSRVSFDLHYRFFKEENGKRSEVALVKTGMICFDYAQTQKVVRIPAKLKEKLS